jgi:hypothetical protein
MRRAPEPKTAAKLALLEAVREAGAAPEAEGAAPALQIPCCLQASPFNGSVPDRDPGGGGSRSGLADSLLFASEAHFPGSVPDAIPRRRAPLPAPQIP